MIQHSAPQARSPALLLAPRDSRHALCLSFSICKGKALRSAGKPSLDTLSFLCFEPCRLSHTSRFYPMKARLENTCSHAVALPLFQLFIRSHLTFHPPASTAVKNSLGELPDLWGFLGHAYPPCPTAQEELESQTQRCI